LLILNESVHKPNITVKCLAYHNLYSMYAANIMNIYAKSLDIIKCYSQIEVFATVCSVFAHICIVLY
jgi:hypothetical protein